MLTGREKIGFLAIVFARVVVQALDVLGLAAVGLLGAMLASGLNNGSDAEFFGYSISIESSETYLWVTAVIAGFFVSKSALAIVLLRVTVSFLARVEADATTEVVGYFFSSDISRLKVASRGEIQWVASTASYIAFSGMLYSGSAVVTESALFLAIFAGFVVVDPATAGIITLFFLGMILIFQVSITKRLRLLGKRLARDSVTVNNSVLDLVNAFREATVLEKRGVFLGRFDVARRRYALDRGLQRFVMGVPRYIIEVGLIIGVMALIVWQFARGELAEGLVITGVFLAGGVRMMAALLPLQNAINDIRMNAPQAARAQDLITLARKGMPDVASERVANATTATSDSGGDGPKDVDTDTDTNIATDINADINGDTAAQLKTDSAIAVSVDNVSFSYPDGVDEVVSGVTLDIQPGHFVALVGPSGAGKTTLADLILGIHTPTSGRVSASGSSPEALRKRSPGIVAYVPQNPGMVSGTLAQNVALGLEPGEIDDARVHEVLSQAGLDDVARAMSHGIHTSLGEQSDGLSGGQIQRLGIARALYSRPRLLVLDEATSALDAETEAGIAQTIEKLRGDTTLVVIAHRLSTIQHADTVFVIDDGSLVASGTFNQVRRQVPLIERYVELMTIQAKDPEDDATQ